MRVGLHIEIVVYLGRAKINFTQECGWLCHAHFFRKLLFMEDIHQIRLMDIPSRHYGEHGKIEVCLIWCYHIGETI